MPGRKRKEPPPAAAQYTVPVVMAEVIDVLGFDLIDGAIADDAPAAVAASPHPSTPVATVLSSGTGCLRPPGPPVSEAAAGRANSVKSREIANWNREERWVRKWRRRQGAASCASRISRPPRATHPVVIFVARGHLSTTSSIFNGEHMVR